MEEHGNMFTGPFSQVQTDGLTVTCVGHAEMTWVGSLKIQCMSLGGGEKQTVCCIDNCREIFISSHRVTTSKYEEALIIAIIII